MADSSLSRPLLFFSLGFFSLPLLMLALRRMAAPRPRSRPQAVPQSGTRCTTTGMPVVHSVISDMPVPATETAPAYEWRGDRIVMTRPPSGWVQLPGGGYKPISSN